LSLQKDAEHILFSRENLNKKSATKHVTDSKQNEITAIILVKVLR